MSGVARNAKWVHDIDMEKRVSTVEATLQHLAPKAWLLGTVLTIVIGGIGLFYGMKGELDKRMDRVEHRMDRLEDQLVQIRDLLLEQNRRTDDRQ